MFRVQWAMQASSASSDPTGTRPSANGPADGPWDDFSPMLEQWKRGLATDDEVAIQLGDHALELFLAQRALQDQGT